MPFVFCFGQALECFALKYGGQPYHLKDIDAYCPLLATIEFDWDVDTMTIIAILNNVKHLTSFSYMGYSCSLTIPAYAQCCNLKKLRVQAMWTDDEVRDVQFQWSGLKELSLDYCECVTQLLKYCINLKHLTLVGCETLVLESELPCLEVLKFEDSFCVNLISASSAQFLPALKEVYCSRICSVPKICAAGEKVKIVYI